MCRRWNITLGEGRGNKPLVISDAVRLVSLSSECWRPFGATLFRFRAFGFALWKTENAWVPKLCSEPYKWSAVRCEISSAVGTPVLVGDLCASEDGFPPTDVRRLRARVCHRATALPAGREHLGVQVLQWRNYPVLCHPADVLIT